MAVRGITFDKQLLKSGDHALEINHFYAGNMGVIKGMATTEDVNGNLVTSEGYALCHGRLFAVVGSETTTVPSVSSGTLYSILVFEIDLTKTNTTGSFLQGEFKIVSNGSAYPALTQQDLNDGGTLYQMEFARFENTVSGVVNLVDTKETLALDKYLLDADFQTHLIAFNALDAFTIATEARVTTLEAEEATVSFTMWASWTTGDIISYAYALPEGFSNGTYVMVACLGQNTNGTWYNLLKDGHFYEDQPGSIKALSQTIAAYASRPCKVLLRKI